MAKFVFIVLSVLAGFTAAVQYTNHTQFDGENYKLSWTYKNDSETFYFKAEVAATGWIGFGFTLLEEESWMRNAMLKYDVMVAGVYPNNTVYSEVFI